MTFLALLESIIAHSKPTTVQTQLNFSLLKKSARFLENKSPYHSVLYEALNTKPFHLVESQLFTHVETRHRTSP